MGYSIAKFVNDVDENLLCSICSAVLEDAVLTPCGHSFCYLCLQRWLARPRCTSCPECRGPVVASQARPIIAMRNLINALQVCCDHCDRGCDLVMQLESLDSHVNVCGYAPVQCAGCACVVNRHDLADHHINCEAIAAAIDEDNVEHPESGELHSHQHVTEVAELACRVTTLELQLQHLKRDLASANLKNRKLERELKQTREELEEKKAKLMEGHYEFNSDYDYGFTSQSILKLNAFIARFLLSKPGHVDRSRVYNAINRCHDNFASTHHQHEVHMLLATAYASNWFTENQKLNFHHLLRGLQQHRQILMTSFR